jgi:hypothetical protein
MLLNMPLKMMQTKWTNCGENLLRTNIQLQCCFLPTRSNPATYNCLQKSLVDIFNEQSPIRRCQVVLVVACGEKKWVSVTYGNQGHGQHNKHDDVSWCGLTSLFGLGSVRRIYENNTIPLRIWEICFNGTNKLIGPNHVPTKLRIPANPARRRLVIYA